MSANTMNTQGPKLYTKDQLIKKLAQAGVAIELCTLDEQISKLRIDAVFENELGEEIFDNSAYEKVLEALAAAEPDVETAEQGIEDTEMPVLSTVAPQAPLPVENAFKLDISENTLNMIARSIAKKIAKQVDMIYSTDSDKMQKITLYEEQNQQLSAKLDEAEKENQRLRLLLNQANHNLNLYKPTAFGLYKFTGKERKR